jgi:hypothetical protein
VRCTGTGLYILDRGPIAKSREAIAIVMPLIFSLAKLNLHFNVNSGREHGPS